VRRESRSNDLSLYEAIPNLNRAVPGFAPGGPGPFGPGSDSDQQNESLWKLIDDRLRGRWKWATLLGLGLGAILAVLGYFTAAPMYQSMGVVRILSSTPVLVEPTIETTDRKIKYDTFVATQIQLMQQDACLKAALDDEQLSKLPFASQPGALKSLKNGMEVKADRDSELVYVSFQSEDGTVARTGLNAILRAYYQLYGQYGGDNINDRIQKLDAMSANENRAVTNLRKARQEILSKYGTTNLQELQTTNMRRIIELEAKINAGKRLFEQLTSKSQERAGSEQIAPPPVKMLEMRDPKLVQLAEIAAQAQNEFDLRSRRYLPGSTLYRKLEEDARVAKEIYDKEYQHALAEWQIGGPETLVLNPNQEVLSEPELKRLESDLSALRQDQKKLVDDLAVSDDLLLQENHAQKLYDNYDSRYLNLVTEKPSLESGIKIEGWGSRTDEPSSDPRKKRAIIGAGLGLMASFGTFFLLGTVDRRAFGASQLARVPGSRIPPCLGVLPDLGASLSDPESSDVASHCVHQIRNQIEAVRDPRPGYVLAITSPFQGDGKTSIVMALGWSYAAAGYNTLLIDCDMVGRSLTRQMGLIGREGLKDALAARELNGSISRLPVDHLSAIPVGVDMRFGPENVRRADLENLLAQVRDKYDVILIDTGPMLGALESTPVTAVADGVVLSVRRGRSRSRLEDCVSRLDMVGTRCVGVILNCAVRSDCNRYVSEASLAAAEEERIARPVAGSSSAIVQTSPGERNALVRAMQSSARARTSPDEAE